MSQSIFSIDGETFNVKISQESIKRSAQILDGPDTERKQDGDMFRQIIGKYINYSLSVDTSLLDVAEYDRLFEVLSSPVDHHSITMPYGQSVITFDAYCSGVEDTLKRVEGDTNYWGGMTWTFVAMSPIERAV